MSTTLVDDTRDGTAVSHRHSLPVEIEELSKLKTDRYDSYLWAQNLRFLVFDGLDSDEGYPRRDDDVAEVTFKDGTKTTMPLDEFMANEPPDVLMSEAPNYPECSFCLQWPRFPRRTKPKTFRLVKFSKPDEIAATEDRPTPCTHFLAVSYCCPRDPYGNPLDNVGTYRVRETSEDGTKIRRLTRAPDGIIDRAVASAIDLGLRMIWVDQECIIQSSDHDRNVGIQAMDLVYEQATATVGILDSCTISRDHIYALEMLNLWMEPEEVPPDFDEFEFAEVLTDFLTVFKDDRYHTRTWTFQEMLSASENGILLFKTTADMDLTPEQLALPAESMILSVHAFPMATKELLQVIRQSEIFSNYLMQVVARLETRDEHVVRVSASLEIATHRLESFHPQHSQHSHTSAGFYFANFGARRICSAAVASTLLKTRANSRVADRLAILANLCGYEVRLDLSKVERRFTSLTTCILALSLLNGDLSLLTPEIYRPIPREDETGDAFQWLTISENQAASQPSWMLPIHDLLPSIRSLSMMPGVTGKRRIERSYVAKSSCFSLPGYLWSVDRCVDMMPVKRLCEVQWRRLLVLRRQVEGVIIRNYTTARLHGLDDEQIVAELESSASAGLSSKGKQPLDRLRGREEQKSYRPGEERGVLTFSADVVGDDPIARETLADILWEILSYLHTALGEVDIANSVWHSIRTDCFTPYSSPREEDDDDAGNTDDNLEEKALELPDEVGQIVKYGKRKFNPFWRALQLDKTHPDDDSYHQIWIIERIMNEGCLWIGKHRTSRRIHYTLPDPEEPGDHEQTPKPRSRILHDQFVSQYLQESERSVRQTKGRFSLFKDDYEPPEPAVYTNTALDESNPADCETRMAVFDVDGPCSVFTPYDVAVETLPRPDCRSFSWCWVVERVYGDDDDDDDDDTATAVPAAPLGQVIRGWRGKTGTQPENFADVMRVLDRVRGMWELMQTPSFNCRFA